ncbi:hypothetical protein H6S08_15960 [Escherichia coli]|nr:hypothetical protein H6S08_15960 [Escherichia coli]
MRHKLKMALGKPVNKPVEHIDQTNESDGSFLMRLARQYGAIASVKNGNLLFIRQGQGKAPAVNHYRLSLSHVRTATVTALPWQIAEPTRA